MSEAKVTQSHNQRVNPPVGPVTSLAQIASAAPAPPAGYARRYADKAGVAS